MCGIAGIIDKNKKESTNLAVRRMVGSLTHRGPDAEGFWEDPSVSLGHRRLKVIDLDSGDQPMLSRGENSVITFNGEIYNYKELRQLLTSLGYSLRTQSDTEVILYLYEAFGEDCLSYLRGMFSFALWDRRHQKLFCARDRLGQKPFFYYFKDGKLVFASELNALMSDPTIPRQINRRAIYYYFRYGYIPETLTIYEGVYKLKPGDFLTWSQDKIQIQKYWYVDLRTPQLPRSDDQAAEELKALLKESVELRMVSDVPLGAFLSGGIDSSIIVSLMAGLSQDPIKTFSIGFEDKRYNELSYSQEVAQAFQTDHVASLVKPDCIGVFPELIKKVGEPFADSSILPTYYVSKLAREHVTVALSGDGADELFAGYDRYLALLYSENLAGLAKPFPRKIWDTLIKGIPSGLDQRDKSFRIKRFLAPLKLTPQKRYQAWIQIHSLFEMQKYFQDDYYFVASEEAREDFFHQYYEAKELSDELHRMMYLDQNMYLPGDLLTKVDIASMANSLEVRSPFLDHKLVEYVWRLRSSMKLRGKESKFILKEAFKNVLPQKILKRRKMGFGVPIRQWLQSELKNMLGDYLFSSTSIVSQIFKREPLEVIYKQHVQRKKNHEKELWSLFVLELWNQNCFSKTKEKVST